MAQNQPLDLTHLRRTLEEHGNPWSSGETSMTVLTEPERRLRLGVIDPPGRDPRTLEADLEERSQVMRRATAQTVGAPPAFDVRNVDGVNYDNEGVRNQGNCGSCVAFGTVAAMEIVYRYTHQLTGGVDLSEAHLFYCHGGAQGATCETGWVITDAYRCAQDPGVTTEERYPYTDKNQACAVPENWRDRRFNIVDSREVTSDAAAMKECISKYGAVTAAMDVYQDFFSYQGGGVYRHVTGEYAGGHAICLLGYNDAEGYWIGRNSWTAGWGDRGYFKIAYGQCQIETRQVVAALGVERHFAAVLAMSAAANA